MRVERYAHTEQDTWLWRRAILSDIPALVDLSDSNFRAEIDQVFTASRPTLAYHLSMDIVKQSYNPKSCIIVVAVSNDNQLLAYTWARPDATCWSADTMVSVAMVHLRLDLTAKQRVRLTHQMLDQVELYAVYAQIPVVCSTTVRHDQGAFLKIHEQRGYSVRGSYAYLKVSQELILAAKSS